MSDYRDINGERSQRTLYNGTLFRSALEADWAMTFDALSVPWEYEKVTLRFPELKYRPDFYLPHSRQWIEVKGVFEPNDCRKILVLLNHAKPRLHTGTDDPSSDHWCPDVSIVTCVPDGHFLGYVRRDTKRRVADRGDFFEFLRQQSRTVELFRCIRCGGSWFADPDASWRCQCCGVYEGARHVIAREASPLPGWPLAPAVNVA